MIVLPLSDRDPVVRLFSTPRTLGTAVGDYLHDAIVTGEIPPGSPLKELRLADKLDVSTTPIRDALNSLADQGLVEIEPNKGKRVAPIDVDMIVDVLRVHLPMWTAGSRWAFERIGNVELSQLDWTVGEMAAAVERGDPPAAIRAMFRFNAIILTASQNRELSRVSSNRQGLIARHILLCTPELLSGAAVTGYKGLLTALTAGNPRRFVGIANMMSKQLLRRVASAAGAVQSDVMGSSNRSSFGKQILS